MGIRNNYVIYNLINKLVMKLWIARDKDSNELYLYKHKPLLNEEQYQPNLDKEGWVCLEIPSSWFSEVTFENSPQEVEIKLVEKLEE